MLSTNPLHKNDWTPEDIGRILNHGQGIDELLRELVEFHVCCIEQGVVSPIPPRDQNFLISVCEWMLTHSGMTPKQRLSIMTKLDTPYYRAELAAIKNVSANNRIEAAESNKIVKVAPSAPAAVLAEAGAW